MSTIRTIISLISSYQGEVHKMDVKSAFFNGDICEYIYMKQPPGFVTVETLSLVCKLNNSINCIKHAPRAWYEKIDAYFLKNGFKRCVSDPNLYVKKFICNKHLVLLLLTLLV